MPTLSKNFTLIVTPQQFLDNCSELEIQETWILIHNPKYRQLLIDFESKPKGKNKSKKLVKA